MEVSGQLHAPAAFGDNSLTRRQRPKIGFGLTEIQ